MPGDRLRRFLAQLPLLWRAVGESDLVCVDIPNESGFVTALICKARNKPLVTQLLGDWEASITCGKPPGFSSFVKSKLAKLMSVVTVRCSQLVFAQGENLYIQFRGKNAPGSGASMVHSTLSDDVFHLRDSNEFHHPVRILSVMGLVPLKRPDLVLDAVGDLHRRGVSVEWWCVGDGPERGLLETATQRRKLTDAVRFLGYKSLGPSLLSLYREADIFVHSSMTEGVPHSLLEAMANSLPIVTTSAGGIPWIVRNGVDAVLVPPGDAAAIKAGILRLIENPSEAKRLRHAAFHRAQMFHSKALAERRRQLIEKTFGSIAA
jgi:glycosyltransferase involved in cell wall biosynthesis